MINAKNNYAVILKESNEIIGTIGLNEDADGNENIRNVGVRIVPQHQNKGYMTEALKAVIDSATDVLSWFCKVEDLRSQHIAKKSDLYTLRHLLRLIIICLVIFITTY